MSSAAFLEVRTTYGAALCDAAPSYAHNLNACTLGMFQQSVCQLRPMTLQAACHDVFCLWNQLCSAILIAQHM